MLFSGVKSVKSLYSTVYYTVWSDVLLTQLLPYLFISFNVWGDKKHVSNRSFVIAFLFQIFKFQTLEAHLFSHKQCIELRIQIIEVYSK